MTGDPTPDPTPDPTTPAPLSRQPSGGTSGPGGPGTPHRDPDIDPDPDVTTEIINVPVEDGHDNNILQLEIVRTTAEDGAKRDELNITEEQEPGEDEEQDEGEEPGEDEETDDGSEREDDSPAFPENAAILSYELKKEHNETLTGDLQGIITDDTILLLLPHGTVPEDR